MTDNETLPPFIVSGWTDLGTDRRVCVQPRPTEKLPFKPVAGYDGLWLGIGDAKLLRDQLDDTIKKLVELKIGL